MVLINVVIGLVQEYRSGQALKALNSFNVPQAQLLRDGVVTMHPASELVPGDMVILDVRAREEKRREKQTVEREKERGTARAGVFDAATLLILFFCLFVLSFLFPQFCRRVPTSPLIFVCCRCRSLRRSRRF